MTWPAEHGTSKKQWPRPLQCVLLMDKRRARQPRQGEEGKEEGGGGVVSRLLCNA